MSHVPSGIRSFAALLATGCLVVLPAVAPSGEPRLTYPATKKIDHVDDVHGKKVPDPYRWLEDDVRTSTDVADWVAAENKVTFAYLEAIPQRESIRKRLTELWNYEKFGAPFKAGGRYYHYYNSGLQNQNVLYTRDRLEDEPRILLDPNTWSKDGTVALAGTSFSDDGRYLAYGVSEAGSDWNTWKFLNLESGETLPDELKWMKFGGMSWTKDGRGLFYSRYDAPQEGQAFQSLNLNQKVWYHRAGTPQSEDVLVYKRPDEPEWGFGPHVTDDGRYLVITVWKGTDHRYRVLYRDLNEPNAVPEVPAEAERPVTSERVGPRGQSRILPGKRIDLGMVELIDSFENEFSFVGNDGTTFYFKTDVDAPRKRVIAIDLRKPARENWREIVPQTTETLEDVGLVGNLFVCEYLKDATTQVKLHDMTGAFVREVEFPGLGTATGFSGKRTDTETFYSFSSFATPATIYRYDLITGKSTLLRQAKVDVNPADYEVKQVFYRSKDGTKVPMFVAHKKGLKLDGDNPTLLYGYGGFNISLTPGFSITRIAWMEMGGVFAMPNLRGGGEYGEEWHQGGTKLNKQNVFDDFIGAAEWLIENKYTSSKKLAIQGGSNGGLLVGACMTQRPELFAAALPAVGVMDMLRFHKFTAGRFWVDDYGSADDERQFDALLRYSPYHNLKPGTRYPATMVTTADTDDRVVPGHSFKFAARLQECHQGDAPVLIRIETRAGHGAGKPTTKQIEEAADMWAFLVKVLGMRGE